MSSESAVQREIWFALGRICRLFRLNTGKAWLASGQPVRLQSGDMLLPGARPVAIGLGLANGSPVVGAGDLIGMTTVRITPEMVGCKVAVFTSIECKRSSGGRTTPEQKRWAAIVQAAGGIAGVANSPGAALDIVKNYRPPIVDMLENDET